MISYFFLLKRMRLEVIINEKLVKIGCIINLDLVISLQFMWVCFIGKVMYLVELEYRQIFYV